MKKTSMPFLKFYFSRWVTVSIIVFYSCFALAQQTEPNNESPVLKIWETDFQQTTYAAFNELEQHIKIQTITDIKTLIKTLNRYTSTDAAPKRTALIYKHRDLILNNIFEPEIARIHQWLLDHNQLILAAKIQKKGADEANLELLDNIHFQLANYYASNQQWRKTISHVTQIQEQHSLNKKNQQYATLLYGIALQHIRKHRDALRIFEKIPKSSRFYKHAQLNSAIAFIRQGWWTDAQIALTNAYNFATQNEDDAFINRLHVTLGYSQLQNEFYRDARKSFRKVNLGSQYENRALLGLGLAALSQEDYAGALNVFERVKARSLLSLSGLESYLLVAYTQLQSGDHIKAKQNYNQAILYFEHAILKLENNHQAVVNDNDYSIPNSQNGPSPIELLEYLSQSPLSHQLKKAVAQQLTILKEEQNNHYKNRAKQTIAYIKSYISQCEFGLASLYDEDQ